MTSASENIAEVAATQATTVHKLIDIILEAVVKYSFQVLGGIIVLVVGWFIAKIVCRFVQTFLERHNVDVTVVKFLIGTTRLIIMAFAGLVALGKFGIEIAPFIAGLSVVGFGTSFALQGPLSNYAAGASLIFTKPFKVGDIIEVVGVMGEVQDMTLPRTILKTVDGTMIVIPNKHIIGEIIHNFLDLKRVDIKVGVGYKSDVEKAIHIIEGVISQEKRIFRNEQKPKVGISEFAESSVNLYARIWCKQADYWDVLFDLNKKILAEFNRQQIEIPFPQRDVHMIEGK